MRLILNVFLFLLEPVTIPLLVFYNSLVLNPKMLGIFKTLLIKTHFKLCMFKF